MNEQRPRRTQRLHELLPGLRREAEHVDDGIGPERRHALAEHPFDVFRFPVHSDPLDPAPLRRGHVGVAFTAAERHDLVARSHQARDQVAPDMPGGADDDDAAHAARP
ncbi:MAG TPA: hypothetical protein VHW96_15565 [Solirubrobacteraceae bacterium]|nr:hypothetical protein [Solirubrobacteraceae bacterium]